MFIVLFGKLFYRLELFLSWEKNLGKLKQEIRYSEEIINYWELSDDSISCQKATQSEERFKKYI